MEILHCMLKSEYEEVKDKTYYGEQCIKKEGFLHCSTWNSFYEVAPFFMKDETEKVLLCIDTELVQAPIKWEDNGEGILYPHIYGPLNMDSIIEVQPFLYKDGIWDRKACVHILMNTSCVDEDWCFGALNKHIHGNDRVCVVAFSFWDDTTTIDDWNTQYAKDNGVWYKANTDVWKRYGIAEEQVVWVNYFEDSHESAKNKIVNSSVVFFTGGAPDLMMKRIHEFDLQETLARYQGVMIGYSAGAMIQLREYHITPDVDYPSFSYEEGLLMVDGFDIEVHYEETDVQHEYMKKVIQEKQCKIYAIYDDGGVVVKEDTIETFGRVKLFDK
ncbi:DUF952 domain-containing protein [Amedibacillus sp. YH-ame6]